VQDAAGVDGALLRQSKVLKRVRVRSGAEEHLAVVEEHAHVVGLQRRWLAHWHAVGDVGGREGSSAAA
jgi:hypothetical protein